MTPFRGLKVTDLSTVLAGPSVATFFAELGAEVIKIENPTSGGDVTRHWKLAAESPDAPVSAYFASINFRKSYLNLDLNHPDDRSALDEHIRTTDILVTNFKSGDDVKFGLTRDALRSLNPQLIHAKIKGFTSDENRVAFDVVLQAETGFMYMNGTPEASPVKMPVALIDVLAAHHLKEGILCALLERGRTNQGQVVEVSLEQAGIASLVNQASNYLMTGTIPKAAGSLHPNIAPYGETMTCSDGKQLVLAVGSDRQFSALCEVAGCPELITDARFASNQLRVIHRKTLAEELSAAFLQRPRSEWMPVLISRHIPAGAIYAMDEVMDNPAARAMIREEEISGQFTSRISAVAFHQSPL
jgi:crotonobetainyl-CoA:carnitine CoA-transferase CaiB-like acyl-CoA transferase